MNNAPRHWIKHCKVALYSFPIVRKTLVLLIQNSSVQNYEIVIYTILQFFPNASLVKTWKEKSLILRPYDWIRHVFKWEQNNVKPLCTESLLFWIITSMCTPSTNTILKHDHKHTFLSGNWALIMLTVVVCRNQLH